MAESFVERIADRHATPGQQSFLASHRAVAACQRELGRLADRLTEQLAEPSLTDALTDDDATPVVRLSPDRCIVQLGPVALSLGWLKGSTDPIAGGELLVILWRGAVASRAPHVPERRGADREPSATPLWERVLVPVAEDEATWRWQTQGGDSSRCSSPELALHCTERLREAYLQSRLPR